MGPQVKPHGVLGNGEGQKELAPMSPIEARPLKDGPKWSGWCSSPPSKEENQQETNEKQTAGSQIMNLMNVPLSSFE